MSKHFSGYCSLYDVIYYDKFIIIKHAFNNSNDKRVPLTMSYNLHDDLRHLKSIIGYAILKCDDIGVKAECYTNEDIDIKNMALDGYVCDVIKTDGIHVEDGNIVYVMLNEHSQLPLHDVVIDLD